MKKHQYRYVGPLDAPAPQLSDEGATSAQGEA